MSLIYRKLRPSDTQELIVLFRTTVHQVCKRDYSPEQLLAWAPAEIDNSAWRQRLERSYTIVAEIPGTTPKLVGFSNLEPNGLVDFLYVHAEHQGEGIATALLAELEREARARELAALRSDVSITALPFFLRRGFTIEREYLKEARGAKFRNTLVFRPISAAI